MGDTTDQGGASAPLLPKPEWKCRRRLLYAVVLFCGLGDGYCLYRGSSDPIFTTAFCMLTGAAVSMTGSYVFGAAWDDNNWLKAVKDRA